MKSQWVALLRGINVGGHNKLPMAELRQIAKSLGWGDLATYIASGNLVFSASGNATQLANDLQSAIQSAQGIDVSVIVLSAADFRSALATCPFAPDDLRRVHALFLLGTAALDDELIAYYTRASETVIEAGNIVWLHTPEGYGRSVLASKMDKVIGAAFTARNLRTARKIAEMLSD